MGEGGQINMDIDHTPTLPTPSRCGAGEEVEENVGAELIHTAGLGAAP